jgi:hypothetical protein
MYIIINHQFMICCITVSHLRTCFLLREWAKNVVLNYNDKDKEIVVLFSVLSSHFNSYQPVILFSAPMVKERKGKVILKLYKTLT